jgi:hypothetical protein
MPRSISENRWRVRGWTRRQERGLLENPRLLRSLLVRGLADRLKLPLPDPALDADPRIDDQIAPLTTELADIQVRHLASRGALSGALAGILSRALGDRRRGRTSHTQELRIARGEYQETARHLGKALLFRFQELALVRLQPVRGGRLPRRRAVVTGRLHPRSLDMGRVWKDFIALCPPESMHYSCSVGMELVLSEWEATADLLQATAVALREIAPYAAAAGQPIGFVEHSARQRTRIAPMDPEAKRIPFLLFRTQRTGTAVGCNVEWHAEGSATGFRQAVKEALEKQEREWSDVRELSPALIAINVEAMDRRFSLDAAREGFRACRERHPWLVYGNGRGKDGTLHLEAAVDHVAADGRLSDVFLQGERLERNGERIALAGVAGHYQALSGKRLLEPSATAPAIEDYEDVVVVRIGAIRAGADVCLFAYIWALNLLKNFFRKKEGGSWHLLSESTSVNFTVTGDPLRPLVPASVWVTNPDAYPEESQHHGLRHVLGAVNCLIGFKIQKDRARQGTAPPEEMTTNARSMAIVSHARVPDRLMMALLRLNRHPRFTALRAMLFPSTGIVEADPVDEEGRVLKAGLTHTTVAGRDLPNVVIVKHSERTELVFSIEPESRFFPAGRLAPSARWLAGTMEELIDRLLCWREAELESAAPDVCALNQRLDDLFLRKWQELERGIPGITSAESDRQ